MLIRWLVAFAVTQLVEVPIYTRALRGRVTLAFAASLLTHPLVWFAFPHLGKALGLRYPLMVVLAEAFAISAEAIFLERAAKLKRAWLWSLAANAASVAVGLTLRHTLGWP
jgi:hypothetical protein